VHRKENLLIIGLIVITIIGSVFTLVLGYINDIFPLFSIATYAILLFFGVKFIRKMFWVDKKRYRR
jgi:uncharacterized membrane protein